MNPNWESVKCFVEVARSGSITDASEGVGLSVAAIARRIDGLEEQLNIKLFRRGPGGAKLTEAGKIMLDYAERGAEHLEQLARTAKSLTSDLTEVPIRISSTEPMIADVLAPAIPELHGAHPSIQIELESSLELSNLNRGDADIAIRMVRPTSETLITKKLTSIEMGLFASKSFLKRRDPIQLKIEEEPLLWYDLAYGDIAENIWLKSKSLESSVIMWTGSVRALTQAAAASAGIAPLPEFIARKAGLVRVSNLSIPARTPWLVFHRDTRKDPRQKAVRDWIQNACETAILLED